MLLSFIINTKYYQIYYRLLLQPNTVLSFRVVVDRSVVVPSGSRISLTRQPKSFDGTIINSDDDVEVPQGVDGEEDADSDFDSDFDSPHSGAIGGPDPAIIAAAMSLAADGIPESNIDFANDLVGPMGAGFSWATAAWGSLAPPTKAVHDAEKEVECLDDAESDDGKGGGVEANLLAEDQVEEGEGHVAEPHFKREVAETFLRCIKEKISHENVVIELNGLKIAEDRTFADCARYMLTTALGLCLPPPHIIIDEYKGLYNAKDINSKTKEGRLELLRRATIQLRQWQDLLQKFVRGEEDQVELLLTLEEFCGEEGDFEETGERGADYVGIFPQLLKVLYDLDVVSEEALVAWAKEKEMAEEQEKQFLRLAQPFLDWLQEAEEESDEEDSDEE